MTARGGNQNVIHSKHLITHSSASSTSESQSLIVTQLGLHSVWKSINEVPTLSEPNDSGVLSKSIALGGKTIAIGCIIASLHATFGASAGTASFVVRNGEFYLHGGHIKPPQNLHLLLSK